MQIQSISRDGVIFGKEHESSLFIRKASFSAGYTEDGFHVHENSFEYYHVLVGSVVFESESGDTHTAEAGDIVFFSQAEKHRIVEVNECVEMLLYKRVGSVKSVL